MKPKPKDKRAALLNVLREMPDEAFGWFVAWAGGAMVQFPDGLGGFQTESRKSIETLRKEARAFMEAQR